jgi:anti-sigma regulatory factor (Ser/Thr protein kinase)
VVAGGLFWLGTGHDGLIAATFEMALAPTDAAPGLARAELTAWLGRQLDGGALVDNARLLVSEIVTNSIRHAQVTTAQPLRLIVSLDASTLRVELHDTGTDGTVARRTPSRDDGAGGFGLDLVARVSSAWGVQRDGDGTTVWIELPARPD